MIRLIIIIIGIVFAGCNPRNAPEPASRSSLSSFQDSNSSYSVSDAALSSAQSSNAWRTYISSELGIAIDIPEVSWDPFQHNIVKVSAGEGNYFPRTNAPIPFKGKEITINSSMGGGGFRIYIDTIRQDLAAVDIVRARFGSTCRVEMQPIDEDLVSIAVKGEKDSTPATSKCNYYQHRYILYSKSRNKIAYMELSDETLFYPVPPDTQYYDGAIATSLRFVDTLESVLSSTSPK